MDEEYGELIPLGGGDDIVLRKREVMIGRRESCDIVLRFPNVSAHHCQLSVIDGYWYVKDLGSSNGIKVNGEKCKEHFLQPGDTLAVAKHQFEIKYSPSVLGAVGPPPAEIDVSSTVFKQSLLERAGLAKQPLKLPDDEKKRYDVMSDAAGQIKDPNKPV